MPLVGVTASTEREARPYAASAEKRGATVRLILPGHPGSPQAVLDEIDGLMLTGGEDVDPAFYGEEPHADAGLQVLPERDAMEIALVEEAINRNMPTLCICRGMQLLNVALGGRLIQDLPNHKPILSDGGEWKSTRHSIYLSPGSKLAATIGAGGFFKVNSLHHQGLRDAHKSPRLLTTAYALDDGLIEGLELPGQTWVIGVQWHPELEKECPPSFGLLFDAFVERSEGYGASRPSHPPLGVNGSA